MDSVQRSQAQEVIVQLTPQDAEHLIMYLGWLATFDSDTTLYVSDIDRDHARRLKGYLQTVYEVNGYIDTRGRELTPHG